MITSFPAPEYDRHKTACADCSRVDSSQNIERLKAGRPSVGPIRRCPEGIRLLKEARTKVRS